MTALLVITSLAMAQPPRERDQKGERDGKDRMHRENKDMLNLTDEQKAQMEALDLSYFKATQPTKNKLDIKRAELDAAIEANQSVEKLVKEINVLQGELFTSRVEHKIAKRNVLTENQRVIFDRKSGKANFHRHGKHEGK